MKSKLIKIILIWIMLTFFSFLNIQSSFAADDSWTIIPKGDGGTSSSNVKTAWKVWEEYSWAAANISVWNAFASWIFSWDTIFKFLKHIAKVLSEMWLVIWAAMIIYAGYKYATWVFTWDASKWWQDAVKWAIYWLLIVIFSYAIMKILLSMFL